MNLTFKTLNVAIIYVVFIFDSLHFTFNHYITANLYPRISVEIFLPLYELLSVHK